MCQIWHGISHMGNMDNHCNIMRKRDTIIVIFLTVIVRSTAFKFVPNEKNVIQRLPKKQLQQLHHNMCFWVFIAIACLPVSMEFILKITFHFVYPSCFPLGICLISSRDLPHFVAETTNNRTIELANL